MKNKYKFQELAVNRDAWHTVCPWGRKKLDTAKWLNWTKI